MEHHTNEKAFRSCAISKLNELFAWNSISIQTGLFGLMLEFELNAKGFSHIIHSFFILVAICHSLKYFSESETLRFSFRSCLLACDGMRAESIMKTNGYLKVFKLFRNWWRDHLAKSHTMFCFQKPEENKTLSSTFPCILLTEGQALNLYLNDQQEKDENKTPKIRLWLRWYGWFWYTYWDWELLKINHYFSTKPYFQNNSS